MSGSAQEDDIGAGAGEDFQVPEGQLPAIEEGPAPRRPVDPDGRRTLLLEGSVFFCVRFCWVKFKCLTVKCDLLKKVSMLGVVNMSTYVRFFTRSAK